VESHVSSFLVGLETTLPDYNLAEPPDCVRYTLGDQKACAYIYTVSDSLLLLMVVLLLLDKAAAFKETQKQ
jgi:hypothetical protein